MHNSTRSATQDRDDGVSVTLLPCPFCGDLRPEHVGSADGGYVECGLCLATMPEHDPDVPGVDDRWNTRLAAQPMSAPGVEGRSPYNFCDGTGLVCENHPQLAWAKASGAGTCSCDCGAGMDCSGCAWCPDAAPAQIASCVEAAISTVNARFPAWFPTPAMLGYARAVAAALSVPTAPAQSDGQDRKFAFRDGQFVNRVSGEPIPHDEPIIIFRARDWHGEHLLREYLSMAQDEHHKQAIRDRMAEFAAYRAAHPERMKEPGITHHIRLNEPAQSDDRVKAIADRVCLDVCELPDRTSPDDWPEAMLVTADELHAIVLDALDAHPSPSLIQGREG